MMFVAGIQVIQAQPLRHWTRDIGGKLHTHTPPVHRPEVCMYTIHPMSLCSYDIQQPDKNMAIYLLRLRIPPASHWF